ncbi:MAG TPA: UDP-glucose/GDP-mannose dehydrogenase family protein [Polyangia bacterium]|nr:UDP-glucose/GDP-mannose dehydrogenase family protein [Polyangia bacterium]
MRLAVLGTGYVGLVAGAGFADFGNDVCCVDIDADKVARLERGELPIYEPGLEPLLRRNVAEGRLTFTTDIARAVRGAEVAIIAVGTPSAHDGSADLSQVLAAAQAIGRALDGFAVIVTKSTVPVGATDRIKDALAASTQQPFAVASNPEFLKEGDAVNDFMKPDRVIIGTDDERARDRLRLLYGPFVRTNDRILFMDARSAELTKYAANAYLATRISFMNDVANLCERVGADVEMVRRGMGMDQRIGPKFLFPGIGYGGSCFPKDVKAAVATAREAGGSLEILEAVHRVNERQKALLAEKIIAHYGRDGGASLAGKTIALWGLAFKPGTDDTREAPSLTVIERLLAAGAKLRVHDPVANGSARRVFGERVEYFDHNYDAAAGAHGLALCTEWHQFRRPNFRRLKELLAEPVLFDGRNIWEPSEARALGFTYYGIGRR